MNKKRKVALLIVGMHRSGTSAAARVINLLGFDIGRNLLKASQDNQEGYWESIELYGFHESLLKNMNLSWDSISCLSEDSLKQVNHQENINWIKQYLITEFIDTRRILVKDPRLARFLPLWKEVLLDLGFDMKIYIPFRNPSEVISSINIRETTNILHRGKAFSNQYGAMLWLRHILEAERDSRGLKRSFVEYYSLLKDWRLATKAIEVNLDLQWCPKEDNYDQQIDLFLRPDLYHSKEILIDEIESHPWVSQAFKSLLLLELDPYDPTAMQTLDKINEELARADGIFTEIIKESEAKAKHLESKEEKNQQQIADLQSKLAHIEYERNIAMQDSFQELRLERDKLLAQVQDLSMQVTSLTQENEGLKVSDNSTKDKSQIKHE